MDLLGGYSSDSDENEVPRFPVAVTIAANTTEATADQSTRALLRSQDTKQPPPASTTTQAISKADEKKRVIGKKLLKLSAVLPEHILNQLQLGGGVSIKKKNSKVSDDDGNDSSDDDDDDENPSSRRKTTAPIAAFRIDYSRDEGLMGLLSELSKSDSTSSRKKLSAKILGSDELLSSSTEGRHDSQAIPSSIPPTEEPNLTNVARNEPLGAAFLTSIVETTKRKRKEPTTVRSIHENVSDRQIDDRKEDIWYSERSGNTKTPSSTSVTTSNEESTIFRSLTSTVSPPLQIKASSSLRSAAPPVGISTTTYSSHKLSTYAPLLSHQSSSHKLGENDSSYEKMHHHKHQDDITRNSAGGKTRSKKKKSRKRQMEQMLRAGKLDEVQGDHFLEGVSHVYNQEGDHPGSAMSMMSSTSSNGVGVRVVPTGSYDATIGATAMSTDVTNRQKNSNQLNSLLANAASLESHRAQNPQFHMMGSKGKGGSHRATAKRKYGW